MGGGGGSARDGPGAIGLGGVRVDVNRSEVFVKVKSWGGGGSGRGGGVRGGGHRVDVNKELKLL